MSRQLTPLDKQILAQRRPPKRSWRKGFIAASRIIVFTAVALSALFWTMVFLFVVGLVILILI